MSASLEPLGARLQQAQWHVTCAMADLARATRLRDEGALPLEEYERRVREHALAEAELKSFLEWLNGPTSRPHRTG
jgi:hypothetical protein